MALSDLEQSSGSGEGQLTFVEVLRMKLNGLVLHRTSLWEDIRSFASWLEFEAGGAADRIEQGSVLIELNPDATVRSVRMGAKLQGHDLDKHQRLWGFLRELNIDRVELSVRLERNQIEDVMAFLYCRRMSLINRKSKADACDGGLFGGKGMHVACTDTSIVGSKLTISYSYCTLRFSHIVHWFEQRNKKFNDHRTLFHSAPRYAVLIAIVVTAPGIFYACWHGLWYLAMILSLAWFALFGLVYMLFMVVGSVEYDNEEKAYHLGKAFGQLQKYTARIQADINRARIVQEKFLPDPVKMPFGKRVEWSASFKPADEVGGDYFDVSPVGNDKFAVIFADVSGHGMAAAFITAILKTAFQSWIDSRGTLTDLAEKMNLNLCRMTPVGSFAAVFIAVLDVETAMLTYANLGHQPEPWHIPADREESTNSLNMSRCLIMGIEEDVEINTTQLAIKPGDTILFVSDGIVENLDVEGNEYGIERFEQFLESHRPLAADKLVKAIREEAEEFSRDASQSDDRTILAFRIKNQPDGGV